jgi:hypothetical protein
MSMLAGRDLLRLTDKRPTPKGELAEELGGEALVDGF